MKVKFGMHHHFVVLQKVYGGMLKIFSFWPFLWGQSSNLAIFSQKSKFDPTEMAKKLKFSKSLHILFVIPQNDAAYQILPSQVL